MNNKLVTLVITFFVAFSVGPFSLQAQVLDVGAQTDTFEGDTRGYFFTAPVDLIIEGIFAVEDASTLNQDVEILFLNQLPPSFSSTTLDFNSVFRATDVPGGDFISTSDIFVSQGDIVGVLGSRGPNSINSLGDAPFTSSIFGNQVRLFRLGMNADLRTTPATSGPGVFTFPSSTFGRVELQFRAVPEPSSFCLIVLISSGILIQRKRKLHI